MTPSKIVSLYYRVETAVVRAYNKVEAGAVRGYTRVEDFFVSRYLLRDGETLAEAKARLKNGR